MNQQIRSIKRLDTIGMSASLICAAHCAVLPLILTISSLSSLAWLESPWLEVSFIGASLMIASYSLTRAYLKHHHIFKAILIVVLGFSFIIFSRFMHHGALSHLVTAVGGVIVAYAHLVNWKLTRDCKSCEDNCQL